MKLHELHAIPGANKAVTRKGRGIGSGNGKTAGFGSKGQKARSGVKHAGFEGGQMPLARRLPKVGFNNIFATQYAIVNVADLEAAFNAGDVVDTEALKAKGLVKKTLDGVKVLGNGELTKALVFGIVVSLMFPADTTPDDVRLKHVMDDRRGTVVEKVAAAEAAAEEEEDL